MLQTIAELTAQLNEKSFELEVIYYIEGELYNMLSLVFVLKSNHLNSFVKTNGDSSILCLS